MKWRSSCVVCCCLPAHRARAVFATAVRGGAFAACLTCKARRRLVYRTVKHKAHALERDGHCSNQLAFVSHALNRRSHKAAYLSVFTYLLRSNSEITRKNKWRQCWAKTSKCTWGKISGLLRFCFQEATKTSPLSSDSDLSFDNWYLLCGKMCSFTCYLFIKYAFLFNLSSTLETQCGGNHQ